MADCGHFSYTDATPGVERLGLGVPALEWASLGYAVLPLARGGPRPHFMLGDTGGVHHASRDPERIRAWWLADPAANIGVATGSASGLAVIDLDVKKGRDGIRAIRRFEYETGCPLPSGGLWTRTPSGGVHLWMRAAGGVRERPDILPGVDVKGDGGLVVAAPSMKFLHPILRPGERPSDPVPVPYVNHGCPCTLPAAPEWLAGWLETAPFTRGWRERNWAGPAPELGELRESGAATGYRNRTFYRVACSLYRRMGTGPEASARVAEELRAIWDHTDKTGFGWGEVLTAANSARRFIAAAENRDRAVTESAQAWLMR